jgi:hypothetical protein
MTHKQGSPDDIISTYFAKGKAYMRQTTHINYAIK